MGGRFAAILGVVVLCVGVVAATALSNGSSDRRSPGEISTRYVFSGSAIPIEGSVSYVVLRRRAPNGRLNTTVRAQLFDARALSASARPGRYRISAYQRICSGTCENLDPPSHGCGRNVRVSSGERVRATIEVDFSDEHCRIRLR